MYLLWLFPLLPSSRIFLEMIFVVFCLKLAKAEREVSKMAVIRLVDIDSVPEYVRYFDITLIPATLFFFNAQHMKCDYGYCPPLCSPRHAQRLRVFAACTFKYPRSYKMDRRIC